MRGSLRQRTGTPNARVLAGHGDWVHALPISSDSRWLASASQDLTARLWDLSVPDPNATARLLQGASHELRQDLDRNLTPSADCTTFSPCASSSFQCDSLSGRQVAARHHLRPLIIELSPHAELNIEQLALFDPKTGFNRPAVHSDVPPTPRRIRWRRLLARVFSVDLTRCPLCEGPLNIIEAVVDPARIAVLLEQRRDTQAREASEAAGQTGRDADEVGRHLDDAGTCAKPRVGESGCGTRGPPPTIGRARWSR